MADRFEMRLEEGERGRWQEAAGQAALSSFVRACVEERIAGRLTQAEGIERMAARVGDRLEALLDSHLHRLDASLHSAQARPALPNPPPGHAPTPTAYVPVGPQPWNPTCYSADLHRGRVVCNECGGSFKAKT